MAPVGQDARTEGISQVAASFSLLTFGGFVWMPTTARSEQWTAPHMLMQQATAMRSFASSLNSVK